MFVTLIRPRVLINFAAIICIGWVGIVFAIPQGCVLPRIDDTFYSSYEFRTSMAEMYQEVCVLEPNGVKLHLRLRPYEYDLTFPPKILSTADGGDLCGG